jgi:hypothetical protein
MKERPILFNGEMVRAIREGRKTQTRRVIKNHPGYSFEIGTYHKTLTDRNGEQYPACNETFGIFAEDGSWSIECPLGNVGDRLWVRESFLELRKEHFHEPGRPRDTFIEYLNRRNGVAYMADTAIGSDGDDIRKEYGYRWRPSIHMPRWASRITLEITGVWVERLNDISEADAAAEGCDGKCPVGNIPMYQSGPFVYHYAQLWESINGSDSWSANPWVWVITFQKVEQ